MIKRGKWNKKIVALFLALLLIFEVSGSVLANQSYKGDPKEYSDYYIEVNEEYTATNGRKNKLHGYGIYGQDVASHEVVYGAKEGLYENRTYNIELTNNTPGNSSFDLVFDVDNSAAPMFNRVPGLVSPARIFEYIENLVLDDAAGIFGTSVELKNGEAQMTLYVYESALDVIPAVHTFNFTIADADTSNDPDPEDVTDISITTPPTRTNYIAGEKFERSGMVVIATLTDGSQVPVAGYQVEPEGPLTLGTDKVVISFGEATVEQAITVISSTDIENVQIENGQMLSDYEWIVESRRLEKLKNTYNAVVHYGEEKGVFSFLAGKNVEVHIGEEKQAVNEDGLCTLSLPTSVEGTATVVTVKSVEGQADYTFNCYSQAVRGLPTAVTDYLCIASQYTNGNGLGPYGVNAAATLRGTGFDTTTGWTEKGPTSLGNFGGYITYYYEEAIKDDPKNPYGVDFIVIGNSHNGSGAFAEPGNVLVSEDGENWYTLAASLHYDNAAIWDYEITYMNSNGRAAWTDNQGQTGTSYHYPMKMYYPLFPWSEGDEEEITLSGVLLNPNEGTNEWGNTVPPFAEFGYADVGNMSDKASVHPYKGISGGIKNQQDSFDLKWAVDEDGHLVQFPNGIHYVKVQTANNIDNGAIGEKSTEVNTMRTVASASAPVGQTGAPESIAIDGREIQMEDGKEVYDAAVSGAFDVKVNTDAENIYINSHKGDSVGFYQMPNHEMLRVIVQDGEKEPWIGYINLTEGDKEEGIYSVITFDPAGGNMNGNRSRTYLPGMKEEDKIFPIPDYMDHTFLGWYDGEGNKYTGYTEDMPKELNLKAKWQDNREPREDITVSFRLVGSTLAQLEDENDTIDLSDGDWKGAEYVTWIATKGHTMPYRSTAGELFDKSLTEAGFEWENPGGNYVTAIYAPKVYGGYELREFTNGQRSGWMYTVNGRHPNVGLADYELQDGDEVVWHYVNDYLYEVSDWFDGSLGDEFVWDKWLEAEDIDPEREEPDDETAAKVVDDFIDLINDPVTLADADTIAEARAAYENLNEAQKDLVTKLDKLEAAEETLANLRAVKVVEDLIDAIGEVTLESEAGIDEARTAYEKLSEAQKDLVSITIPLPKQKKPTPDWSQEKRTTSLIP